MRSDTHRFNFANRHSSTASISCLPIHSASLSSAVWVNDTPFTTLSVLVARNFAHMGMNENVHLAAGWRIT